MSHPYLSAIPTHGLGSTVISLPNIGLRTKHVRTKKAGRLCKKCSSILSIYNHNKYCFACMETRTIIPSYEQSLLNDKIRNRNWYYRKQKALGKKVKKRKKYEKIPPC